MCAVFEEDKHKKKTRTSILCLICVALANDKIDLTVSCFERAFHRVSCYNKRNNIV